ADARTAPLPEDADVLIVDPPRAGLAAELRADIAAAGVPRLLYVSCDVATWARDVADLEQKGYRLTRLEPFDFYPHTHHLEVLSELTRVRARGAVTEPAAWSLSPLRGRRPTREPRA